MVLVTPGLHDSSIYILLVAEAATEATGFLLLLASMVTPDGKALNERSWAARGISQWRAGLGVRKTWHCSHQPGIDRQFFSFSRKSWCAECKRKIRCLEMGWQGHGAIIRDRVELVMDQWETLFLYRITDLQKNKINQGLLRGKKLLGLLC